MKQWLKLLPEETSSETVEEESTDEPKVTEEESTEETETTEEPYLMKAQKQILKKRRLNNGISE